MGSMKRRVALADLSQRAGMERRDARANELRTMATDALALVNAKRAENGLAELTGATDWESCAMVKAQEAASNSLIPDRTAELVYREQ